MCVGGKRAWEGENVAMQRCVVVLQLPCLHVALLCKPRAQGVCVCVEGGGGGGRGVLGVGNVTGDGLGYVHVYICGQF